MRLSILTVAVLLIGCKGSELPQKDLLREARIGCERGDALACFHAGSLSAEEQAADRALSFYMRGCAAKHGPSCDAVAAFPPQQRAAGLAQGCNAGDLLSCARVADGYPKDADGLKRAKALREQVCRQALILKPETPARDVHGASHGCAQLAAMHAKGEGAPNDALRALRLETLATMLRTEALARYAAEDDAAVEARLKGPKLTPVERDRVERIQEAEDKAREALMAASSAKDVKGAEGHRSSPITPIEELFFGDVVLPAAPQATGDDAATCRDTGDPITCSVAGAQAEKADPQAPLEIHVSGCNKKPEHCWSLVVYADILLKRRDPARAAWLLERGCEAKSAVACMRLGEELDQGERGIAQDLPKAARMLDKGCQYGSARACYMLAALVEDGRGSARDAGRAKQLRAKADGVDRPTRTAASPAGAAADEQACRSTRDAFKCASAGAAVQDFDAVKAEELFRIGCSTSKTQCGLWAFAIDRLRKDDPSRGMRLLEQGCEENHALACHALAEVLHLGWRSVPRSEDRAGAAYLKACELGDTIACREAASRAREQKDVTKADELKEKALKADEASARGDSGDRWARDAESRRARGPHAQELDRARADFRSTVDKVHARAQLRDQRVTAKNAGRKLQPLPPPSKEDAEAQAVRVEAIRRLAAALVAPK